MYEPTPVHLIIEGKGARPTRLANKDRVTILLHNLVHMMDVRILHGPQIEFVTKEEKPKDWALPGTS